MIYPLKETDTTLYYIILWLKRLYWLLYIVFQWPFERRILDKDTMFLSLRMISACRYTTEMTLCWSHCG